MKKAILLIMIICVLSLGGCYPANVNENENSESKEGETTGFTDLINVEDGHISLNLMKNLIIDADVTEYNKYSGKEYGLYYVEKTQEIEYEKFYGIAEETYGDEIIVTPQEAEEEYLKDKNTKVVANIFGDKHELSLTFTSSPLMGAMDFFTLLHSNWADKVDEKITENAVNEACDIVSEFYDLGCFNYKRYIWTDKTWYDKASYLGIQDNYKNYKNQEYYVVRHIQGIEELPIVSDSNYYIYDISSEEAKDKCLADTGEGYYWIPLFGYFDVYIDNTGKLMEYKVSRSFAVEEQAFRYVSIVDIKEVIQTIYNRYSKTYIIKPIEFYDFELVYYGAVDSEGDEVKVYVRPCWIARCKDDNIGTIRYFVIDGESGKIIFEY